MTKILKNYKLTMLIYFLMIISIIFAGCENVSRSPLTVTFMDVSGAMSADHTISIKVGEEDDFKDKYLDIFVKADTDGVQLTLFQEFASEEDKVTISLIKDAYVSLDEYKLFNMEKEQSDSMVGYGDVLATNLVVNSNKEATLTFLAKVGDKKEGKFQEISPVSNEYTLKVRKKV